VKSCGRRVKFVEEKNRKGSGGWEDEVIYVVARLDRWKWRRKENVNVEGWVGVSGGTCEI
jgi:hypothetical protein